jgi:hypothetical protein
MNGILDALLVGIALLASALYALLALGPRPLRQRARAALASCGLPRIAEKTRACGGCDDCTAPDGSAGGAGGETRVPLDGIGHRDARSINRT